jgi:Co/Zn/Cd efflux system component
MMSQASINLLILCSMLDQCAKLWTNLICFDFGLIQNLGSIVIGIAIVSIQTPLFLDVAYILLQKVHPEELVGVIESDVEELRSELNADIHYHLWALDKSYRICTVNVALNDSTQLKENLKSEIRKKLD